eukprot:3752026-Amphidinium_carterae.1
MADEREFALHGTAKKFLSSVKGVGGAASIHSSIFQRNVVRLAYGALSVCQCKYVTKQVLNIKLSSSNNQQQRALQSVARLCRKTAFKHFGSKYTSNTTVRTSLGLRGYTALLYGGCALVCFHVGRQTF